MLAGVNALGSVGAGLEDDGEHVGVNVPVGRRALPAH